jgi:hypothetical protein
MLDGGETREQHKEAMSRGVNNILLFIYLIRIVFDKTVWIKNFVNLFNMVRIKKIVK